MGENDPADPGLNIAHADIPANYPGITFESEVLEDGAVDIVLENENQQSHETAVNEGFSPGNCVQSTGVLHDMVIFG